MAEEGSLRSASPFASGTTDTRRPSNATRSCAPMPMQKSGDIRVVDESGEDYLYPADWFVAVEVPKAVQDALLKASSTSRDLP